ncbi:hypothetical protein [Pedobacter polysacchareus]|uniref:hypothetical protein n=1 Tax=Pedobacter polysacchareus TaxID=2861973 RepID=UPI001C9A27B5|nr:hypothetical protein [Pedobacter polysacchareus]
MKIIYPIVGLLGTVLFFSCTSDKRGTNKNDDTVAVPSDTTATTMIPAPAPTNSIPYSDSTGNEKTVNLVKASLAEMFKDELSKKLIDEQSRKFRLFEHNLNKDPEKEIFVGLTGSNFCGSGGCTVLLLSAKGALITRFTVTGSPILVADTKTKGWNDLILHSDGKDHLIKFDGKTYPSNPSIQPVYTSNTSQTLVKGLEDSDQLYTW